MKAKRFLLPLGFLGWMSFAVGCANMIRVTHTPILPTSGQQVTYTASASAPSPFTIELLVNATLVHTCNTSPCTFTGGPYAAYEGTTVSYLAKVKTSAFCFKCSDSKGYYYFGITDANNHWSQSYIPARKTGSSSHKEDLLFHMADDYIAHGQNFNNFLSDVEAKVYNVYGQQDIIRDHLDDFNFYVYTKTGSAGGCGTVHADADTDVSWRDDDAVLHFANLQDCTNPGLSHFSAEGSNTKAFLHESGHGVFSLADEYCGYTAYFQPAIEPNIFSTEASCRSEQTAKGRNPDACYKFCDLSGGWWGIHRGTTVMTNGMTGEPWGTEAAERVRWFFDNL